MNLPQNPTPQPRRADDNNAEAGGSNIHAPSSSSGATLSPDGKKDGSPQGPAPRFFIRADGQYLVSVVTDADDLWTFGGKPLMRTRTQKYETAVLGFFPDGTATILRLEESFFN